jgi:hypothetical protein
MLKVQTGVPCGVYLISGSRPRFPTTMILLNDMAFISSSSVRFGWKTDLTEHTKKNYRALVLQT